MHNLLEALKPQYDYILIDSCPVLPVSDAVLLSRSVDAVVFVVNSGSTPANLAQEALVRLNRAHAPVVGTVLNQVDILHGRDASIYRDHFSYYDSDTEPVSNNIDTRNGNHITV